MKKLILILMLFAIGVHGWPQETNHNQYSNAPETARYQIIQSELAAKITVKIDKYTGEVFQLIEGETGLSWQLIAKKTHSQDKGTQDKVNYQIFTSGLAVRMTFLLNVNTGATWQLVEDPEYGIFWKALE